MVEVVWVLDHLDDLDADFLRFYRIDITQDDTVDPPRFFKLAYRLPAYQGVMAARVEAQREEAKTRSPSKALRDGTAKEVPLESISEFIDMNN